MRILYYCDEYPPVKSGGIGTVTKIIAEEMVKRGHSVFVMSGILPNVALPLSAVDNGVEIYRFKYFQTLAFLFGHKINSETLAVKFLRKIGILGKMAANEFVRTQKIVRQFIKDNNIDIVEFPDYLKLSDYYRTREKVTFPRYEIPIVARIHGSQSFASYYRDGFIDSINKYNDISFLNCADKIIAVSRFSANFINDKLGMKRNIDVVYNPIDLRDIVNNMNALPHSGKNGTKSIVFIGKIVETKGAFTLIKAFNNFVKRHEDYRLIMIGGGDIERGQSLVDPVAEGHVVFTGYISRKEICEYIANAAFCCVPSYFENFSMVALEIMTLGKALIYTRESSGPEVITDGKNGILVNPFSPAEIEEKMELLSEDSRLCTFLGREAKKMVMNTYTVPVIVTELETHYNNLIDAKTNNKY